MVKNPLREAPALQAYKRPSKSPEGPTTPTMSRPRIAAVHLLASVDYDTPAWHGLAACRGLSSEVFFPQADEAVATAKAVCGECPVEAACLEHALTVREKEGIWGGATEHERRSIIRRRRRAAARERELGVEHAARG